jgi:hypothetical protein
MAPLAVDPIALDGAGTSLLGSGKDLAAALAALAGALSACAGMCGNDPAGVVHGRQYDASAKSLIESMVDLTNGANRIGDGIRTSASNYSKAEVASNVNGAPSSPLPTPAATTPTSAKLPPSAQGGTSASAPPGWFLIQPLVGMVWPNGDSARLRAAALAWTSAGSAFLGMEGSEFGALSTVAAQQMPEAAQITSGIGSTASNSTVLFNQTVMMASNLVSYANQIDAVHAAIIDLLSRVMNPMTPLNELWDLITGADEDELQKIANDIRVILNNFMQEVAALATLLAPIISAAQMVAQAMGRWAAMELQQFGDAAYNVLADVVNAGASIGNAALHHPLDVAAIAGGALLMDAGAGMFGGGVIADATGVGAIVGVPANAAGALMFAGGAVLTGGGAIDLAQDAAGENGVVVMQARTGYPGEGVNRGDNRDSGGKFTGQNGFGYGRNAEAQGIKQYENANPGRWVTTEQRRASVSGAPNGRFYDGLARLPDRTYEGIEIKSGTASLSPGQRVFDAQVSPQNPAYATIVNEQGVVETVKITQVTIRTVPGG